LIDKSGKSGSPVLNLYVYQTKHRAYIHQLNHLILNKPIVFIRCLSLFFVFYLSMLPMLPWICLASLPFWVYFFVDLIGYAEGHPIFCCGLTAVF
jgi:hypothetical protein